ncbi:MAG: carbohydrate-binding domain-containing protein [Bacteroidaceae bacterium]|nr:carbohydrate-binding domain-containing protein [Bacteroidaceae bacterium]
MKKLLLSIFASFALVHNLDAQEKVYVCQGYEYDAIEIESLGDMTFSADNSIIYIGEEDYEISDIDSITFGEPQFPKVEIIYNGNTASVKIPSSFKGVTSSVSGANVTINSTTSTEDYLYSVSGASENGSLLINGDYKLSIELAGLALTSSKGPAIDIQCGKRIAVYLKEGTVNTLTDGKGGTHKGAFNTEGHPEFEGGGTLNVTGNTKHAICAKEYLQFKKSTGHINILGAVSDGIHCGKGKQNDDNSHFKMNGGIITVNNVGSDCIDADDYGCMFINGGTLNLNVTTSDGVGLKCDSIIRMTGGEININVKGTISEGIRTSYAAYFDGGTIKIDAVGNGTKGLRAKKCTKTTDPVKNGGYIYLNGTDLEINVSGSTYTADGTKCVGMRVDKDYTQTAGNVEINVLSNDATGLDIRGEKNITGGTLKPE